MLIVLLHTRPKTLMWSEKTKTQNPKMVSKDPNPAPQTPKIVSKNLNPKPQNRVAKPKP